jgi:hypothetical protein
MADLDHPVGSSRCHPRKRPGPPHIEHLPPRLPGDLPAEQRCPIGDPARVAERLLPVGIDWALALRELLQAAAHVPIKPRIHQVTMAAADHRLGSHRTVVGQESIELRPRRVQPFVGLVKRSRRS